MTHFQNHTQGRNLGTKVSVTLSALILALLPFQTTPGKVYAASYEAKVTTVETVTLGNPSNLKVTINSGIAGSILVDVEIYKTGNKVFQQYYGDQNFNPGETKSYSLTYTPDSAGDYVVKAGIFTNDWSQNLRWFDSLATVRVTSGEFPKLFEVTGSFESPATSAGQSVAANLKITSGSNFNGLVDLEIYTASGQKVFQKFYSNQNFSSGETKSYAENFTSGGTGKFTLKAGIFSNDWSQNFAWYNTLAVLEVGFPSPQSGKLFGVNNAVAEFGDQNLPGKLGTDYVYPTDSSSNKYFASKGLTLMRLPFAWERLQDQPFGPLRQTDVTGLRQAMDAAASSSQKVILDMHNYARYYHSPLTKADAGKLADAWKKLASEFKSHPALYGYEIMNEPHDLPEGLDGWAYLAQETTNAIRLVDSQAYVVIPGYDWQSAARWPQSSGSLDIKDPSNKIIYAAHVYFDNDASGRYLQSYDGESAYPNVGVDRVKPFLNWLASKKAYGMITEYGLPGEDSRWLTVLDNFLATLNSDPRLLGGTYWSAGPWWGGYAMCVEPGGGDKPQMQVLQKYPST